MKIPRVAAGLPALLVLWAGTAATQEKAEKEGDYKTVVTASRSEEEILESSRSVEVLDEADVAETASMTLPALVAETPGVLVQKTNPGGGAPMIRGLIGNKNLYLFDEIRLNNSTWRSGPNQYLNLIDPFVISRVEVLKGPGSLQYGSDAIGGIVNVLPLEPEYYEDLHIGATAAGLYSSAENGLQGRLALHQGKNGFGLLGGGTLKHFGDLSGGGDAGVQPFTGYGESDADLTLMQYFPCGVKLKLAYFNTRIHDAGRIDQLYENKRLRYYDNFHDLLYAKLWGDALGSKLKYRVSLSYQHSLEKVRDLRYTTLDFDEVDRIQTSETTVHTVGATGTVNARFFRDIFSVTGGFDLYADLVGSEAWQKRGGVVSDQRSPFPADSRYILGGFFAALKVSHDFKGFEPGIWGGTRLSIFNAHAPDVVDYGDVDYLHLGVVLSGGLSLMIKEMFHAGVTFSQGFRAPTLTETVSFGDMGSLFEVPNPSLSPERIHTIETFVKLLTGPVVFRGAFFYSFLTEVITRRPSTWEGQPTVNDKPVYTSVNADSGKVEGVEGWLELDLGLLLRLKGVKLKGGVTSMIGEEENCEAETCVTQPMSKFPPLFYTFIAGWYGNLSVETAFFGEIVVRGADKQDRLSQQDRDDPRIPENGTPAWTTLSLRSGLVWRDRIRATLILGNLTNAKYKIHGSGVYEAGAHVSMLLGLGF